MNSPIGWKTVTVKDLCSLGRGRVINGEEIEQNPGIYPVFSSQSKDNGKMGAIDTFDFDGEYVTWTRYYSNEGAIFLRIGNLTREHINLRLDDLVYVQVAESSEGKRTAVQEGDLLISITADLGIIGVIPESFGEAYVNQHIALVRLDSELAYPRFVGHLLSGQFGRSQIESLNESGAKAGLNLPTVEKLLIATPKMNEQVRIAKILDAADKQIERDKPQLKKLAHEKAGLMHDLLTGKRRVTSLLAQAAPQ